MHVDLNLLLIAGAGGFGIAFQALNNLKTRRYSRTPGRNFLLTALLASTVFTLCVFALIAIPDTETFAPNRLFAAISAVVSGFMYPFLLIFYQVDQTASTP